MAFKYPREVSDVTPISPPLHPGTHKSVRSGDDNKKEICSSSLKKDSPASRSLSSILQNDKGERKKSTRVLKSPQQQLIDHVYKLLFPK